MGEQEKPVQDDILETGGNGWMLSERIKLFTEGETIN